MSPVKLISAIIILLVPVYALGQGWFQYSNRIDRFTVNLPSEPEMEEFTYESEFNALFPARRYTVLDGSNQYSVTVVDFTDAQRIHAEMEKFEAASAANTYINDQRASVIRAARQFRQRGSEVTYDGWGHIERVEGQQ